MKVEILLVFIFNIWFCLADTYKKRSECIFPFEYNGKMYDDCITSDASAPWCSPTKKYTGMFFYCNDNQGDSQEKNGAFLKAQNKLMDNNQVLSGDFVFGDQCQTCEANVMVITNSLKQIDKLSDDNERQLSYLQDVENKNIGDILDSNYKDIFQHLKCPSGWYRLNNVECFYLLTNMNMGQARAYCASHKSTVASMRNEEESNVILKKAQQVLTGKSAVMIGITDEKEEGKWLWDDGSDSEYRNWRTGEPNNMDNEDCVMVTFDGLWNDVQCQGNFNPVCRGDILYVE